MSSSAVRRPGAEPKGRKANRHAFGWPHALDGLFRSGELTLDLPAPLYLMGAAATPGARLAEVVARDWEWQMADSPEYATLIGAHAAGDGEGDSRLDDLSLDAFEKRRLYHEQLVGKLRAIPSDGLSKSEQLTLSLLAGQAEQYLSGHKHKAFLMRMCQLEGPQLDFPQVMQATPTSTPQECRRYISRLNAFPLQCDQVIRLFEVGVEEGRTVPKMCLEAVAGQISCVVPDDVITSPLMLPFVTAAEGTAAADAVTQAAALQAMTQAVVPAFKSLLEFLQLKYLPFARTTTSCADLPYGEEMYTELLRFHTTTEMSAAEIYEAGTTEVKRILKEMTTIKDEVKFEGDLEAFISFLRSDSQFYVKTSEQLLHMYRGLVAKVQQQLPDIFEHVPEHPLEVQATPSHAADSAPAGYYFSKGSDRPGVFMVNCSFLEKRPTWQMDVLTLHEAIPGHHMQAAAAIIQQKQGLLPEFRVHMEDRRYGCAPSRRPFYSAYVEGWALYCEGLGQELGLYQDPYSRFGRLSMDMMRACRLVVDTGLHAFGWSFEKAVEYMVSHCAQPLHELTNEVVRYIAWPGQATAYKIGELELRRLRAIALNTAEDESEKCKRLKRFHNICIGSGSIPLCKLKDLVEDEMVMNTL